MLGTRGQLRNRQMLDFKRLGLQTLPNYFKTLNVRLTAWSSAKAAIHKGKGGEAIRSWVKSGNAEVFKLFLAKITARYERQRQIQDAKEEDGALIAERAAFKQGKKNKRGIQEVMEPMPPAGAKGGKLVRSQSKWKMPSPKQIKKEAMDKTIHYMATLAKRDASSAAVVKAIESKLEGTTIKMTTSAHMFAESIMEPEVELDGTLGTLYGKISGVPLVGQTLEQTFTGKNIGEITHVTLRAPKGKKKANDPWLCSRFEVQVGTGNPWVVMTRSGFPGAYKFWLDNKPFNNGPYYGLQRRDFWVLRAVGTAKPAFHKKFARKWPHCHNIDCMEGDVAKFERACAKNPRCNGFSFSAGKKSHGNGCLKMKCGKNAWSERGFGRKTHDYYMKYSSYWAKVVKKREMAAKEKKKKEMSKKEKAKKERSKKAEMKHKEREQKARERAAKAAARKERSTKAAQRAKEINDKEKASKERAAKEKHAKAAERNSKESSAKYERSSKESAYKARFLPPGSCCWFLYGCARCCDKCPGGNHWVGPGTCGTSRKCNRL